MVVAIIRQAVRKKLAPVSVKNWDLPMIIFWFAMYVYCIVTILHLGLAGKLPWFLVMGIIFTVATVYVAVSETKTN